MVGGGLSECLQVYLPFPFETAVFLQVMGKWLGKKSALTTALLNLGEKHTLIFSWIFCLRNSESGVSSSISKDDNTAKASWPTYSSKNSLPKSIPNTAAGSTMASLKMGKGSSNYPIHLVSKRIYRSINGKQSHLKKWMKHNLQFYSIVLWWIKLRTRFV